MTNDAKLIQLEADLRRADAFWHTPEDDGAKAYDRAVVAITDTPADTLAGALVKARYINEHMKNDTDHGCLEISKSLLADLYRLGGAS